jgi:hypothetical protein
MGWQQEVFNAPDNCAKQNDSNLAFAGTGRLKLKYGGFRVRSMQCP